MKSDPKGKEITTVNCSISAGMFKSERMVSVELPDGHEVTALVDRHQVIRDREVSPSEEYKGQVRITDSAEKPSVHPSRASGRTEEPSKYLEIFPFMLSLSKHS